MRERRPFQRDGNPARLGRTLLSFPWGYHGREIASEKCATDAGLSATAQIYEHEIQNAVDLVEQIETMLVP